MPHINDEAQLILEQVSKSTCPAELWRLLARSLKPHGFTMASYHLYDAATGQVSVTAFGHPEPFQSDYISQGFHRVDPIHQFALRNGTPFRWRDIYKLTTVTPCQADFLQRAMAAGLHDGLAFGVFGPQMLNAFVGLGFGPDTPEPSDGLVSAFQLLCQAGHIRYCELSGKLNAVSLTARELETLEWMVQGKSNSVIAQIMHISPHTVDTNVRRIYAKLGVSDRTSATLKGLGTGLVQLSKIVT